MKHGFYRPTLRYTLKQIDGIPERSRTVSTLWLIHWTENISMSPSSSRPKSNSVSSRISFPDSTCLEFQSPKLRILSCLTIESHGMKLHHTLLRSKMLFRRRSKVVEHLRICVIIEFCSVVRQLSLIRISNNPMTAAIGVRSS